MDRASWESKVAGTGCPLCGPRPDSNAEWDLVAKLRISSLYLAKNQTYRGQCLLIFDPRHAARPDQLSIAEWSDFTADLRDASDAVTSAVRPDHVNVASLGNVVPHLHWHVIPRRLGDPRWGAPIWTEPMPELRLDPAQQQALAAQIEAFLPS